VRILLVEDHGDIAEPLIEALRHDRYEVAWAQGVASAHDALASTPFDLAVLDVMLQDGDDAGFQLGAELRGIGFAGQILFISARDAEADRVHGLDLGGDDYLVKPFGLQEFRARVRALLRRSAQTRRTVVDRSPLHVDLRARRVRWDGREVQLTTREFEMLELFALYPERAFTVDELLERFFPEADSGRRVVRVYVSQLRHKLAADAIRTVAGGYRLGPS
jgi:two-component system, OmpR family, response regulator QseB